MTGYLPPCFAHKSIDGTIMLDIRFFKRLVIDDKISSAYA